MIFSSSNNRMILKLLVIKRCFNPCAELEMPSQSCILLRSGFFLECRDFVIKGFCPEEVSACQEIRQLGRKINYVVEHFGGRFSVELYEPFEVGNKRYLLISDLMSNDFENPKILNPSLKMKSIFLLIKGFSKKDILSLLFGKETGLFFRSILLINSFLFRCRALFKLYLLIIIISSNKAIAPVLILPDKDIFYLKISLFLVSPEEKLNRL